MSDQSNPNRRCAHGKLFTESCPDCGYIHPRERKPDPLRDRCKALLVTFEERRPTHQQNSFVLLQTQNVDDLMAFVRAERMRALGPGVEGAVQTAFEPFVKFMTGNGFDKLSDDTPLTAGTYMASRQLTVGHFRKLATAIAGPGGEL